MFYLPKLAFGRPWRRLCCGMPGSVDFRVFTDLVFLVFIYIDHAAATFQYNFMVNKRPIKAKCILHFLAKKVVNQGFEKLFPKMGAHHFFLDCICFDYWARAFLSARHYVITLKKEAKSIFVAGIVAAQIQCQFFGGKERSHSKILRERRYPSAKCKPNAHLSYYT